MVMLLLSQNTISLPSWWRPARPIASWLTPSIRQPSPAMHIGVVIDELLAVARAQDFFGHGKADGIGDALTQRAGGGFDALGVASIRGGQR